MILRGTREDHILFLLRWLTHLDGASLHVEVGAFNERIHMAGTETVEVRLPKYTDGRAGLPGRAGLLIAIFTCSGETVVLSYFVRAYRPMLDAALARLRERFE